MDITDVPGAEPNDFVRYWVVREETFRVTDELASWPQWLAKLGTTQNLKPDMLLARATGGLA